LAQWGEAFEKSADTLGADALRQQAARFDAITSEIMALCGSDPGERVNSGETAASLDKVSNYS
jgi:hypothetical protein